MTFCLKNIQFFHEVSSVLWLGPSQKICLQTRRTEKATLILQSSQNGFAKIGRGYTVRHRLKYYQAELQLINDG